MRNPLLFLALTAVLAAACADGAPTAARPRHSLSGPDRAEFQIHGASYGPNGEEMTDSQCGGTHAWATDSTNWAVGGGSPVWVKETSYDRVGCTYWGGWSQDMRVGGNISIYADGASSSSGVGVVADQQAVGTLENVPVSGTTLYLNASAWSGYRFQYWRIRNAAGTNERLECRADFTLPADTDAYFFFAVFREGTTSSCR
jgi:hypothetical protein